MKSWLGKFAAVLLLAYIFLKFAPAIPISSVVTQKQDLFTVTGEGKVTAVPDTAIISVGILSQQPSVKTAQTQANTVINDITASLKGMGIAAKDIKTSNYSVYPQYDYAAGRNRISNYQVNVNLTITVRDLEKINSVIDTSTAKGANTIGGINLTVDETRQKELLSQARELAVKEAKTKAESLARAAGLSLGRIVNIQESGTPSVPPPYFARALEAGIGGGGDTKIEPGSADITSSVTLSYETR